MSGEVKAPAGQESVFKGVHYSLLDQALLSVSNFLIGLVFIKYASKTDYYAYSQLVGYIALTLAIQAALINTTALTLLPPSIQEQTREYYLQAQRAWLHEHGQALHRLRFGD